jgi:peptide/nickel transport system permease protein
LTSPLDRPAVMRLLHHHLVSFVVGRLAAMLLLGIGITFIAFVLTQMVPGDPAAVYLGQRAMSDPAAVQAFRIRFGLDQPLPIQYLLYLERLAHGDLGTSLQTSEPVSAALQQFIPATAELACTSILIASIFGITFGVAAGLWRGTWADHALRLVTLTGLSTPTFWFALVVIYVFFVRLSWLPSGGRLDVGQMAPAHVTGLYTIDALLQGDVDTAWSALLHLVLPAGVLAIYNTALIARITRASVLEVIGQDYIRAARAKGLPERLVIRRHILRAAVVPVITIGGLAFANVMTGSVLVESIFSWPGVGQFAYQSAINLDRPAIMGACLFISVVYVTLNFIVDLLYGFVDPRIRIA